MKKRMTLMLVIAAVFIVAIGTLKFRQVRAAIAKNSSFQPPPEAGRPGAADQEAHERSGNPFP